MKKKIFSGVLALLLLLGFVTTGWAGSQPDPLISLSYLTETFFAELEAYVTRWVAKNSQGLEPGSWQMLEDGWIISSGYVTGEGDYGDTVTLAAGSGLIWVTGSGVVSSGVLVDATAGTELAGGEPLTAGHRYLAAEDAVVTASAQAQWMAEGKWLPGTGGTVIVPLPFIDVPEDQWYYGDVRFVYENNLFAGVSVDQFDPNGSMWRAMMTTVLYRLAGGPEVNASSVFSDVPEGQWYTNGVIWCHQQGVVNGIGDGLFAPDQDIDRQQIAVMLYQYAVKTGSNAGERGDLSAFSDMEEVASWAEEAMSWAVGAGILNGSDEGKLLPGVGADRAQVAAMLHRFHNWLETRDA